MMRNSRITNIMKITLKIEKMETTDLFYHFGVSLLQNLRKNM